MSEPDPTAAANAHWTRHQKWLVGLVALTVVLDGIDNQLLGIVIPTVMGEWGVPRSSFAPVVSLGYLGMMIGGAAAGMLGDRFGRRTALLGSMVVFGAMTAAAAGADSLIPFAIARLLAGLGLGGAMPNAASLAAEYVPARSRPMAVTLVIVCVTVGGTFAGLLGIRVLPVVGWRGLFLLGGIVPVIVAIALRWMLPESPQFLARGLAVDRSRLPPAGGAPAASLFGPGFRRDTIALWAAFFSCLLSVYLGFAWLTSLLTGAGFDGATANAGITAFNLGGVVGSLAGGLAISRFGSKRPMLTMTTVAMAGAVTLALTPMSPGGSVLPLIAMIGVVGAAINGVQTAMYALAAHVYPTAIRATGVGAAVAFGRIGAVLVGYVGSWTIDLGGSAGYFGLIAMMMLVTFGSLSAVGRHVHRPGKIRT